MNIIKGGVTAAKGFKAAGCEAQIKYKNGKKDMALVYSEKHVLQQEHLQLTKYLQLLLNGTETLYIMKTLHRL